MEVRLLYDDDVLYVGARMFSQDGRIQAPLGRRDSTDQAEHILVSFDTFLDRRTAVVFGVTASGVRLDRYHSSDNEDSYDSGFDPVWRAETQVSGDQWTAELWIPFSQLRFNPQSVQTWGLNLFRFRPTLNEEDYWIVIPRTERAWSSRFGDLTALPIWCRRGASRRCRTWPAARPSTARTATGQSVRRWQEPAGAGGRRRQDGAWSEPHARGGHQPGFRPGRSRSRGSEPDGLRDALPREAAVLSRGRAALQHRPSQLLLLAPHRQPADRAGVAATTSTTRTRTPSLPPRSCRAACRRRRRSGF